MFCRNCGAEMSDTAKFCTKCGTPRTGVVGAEAEKRTIIEDNQIQYELKPEFNVGYKLLSNIGTMLVYFFCIIIIFNPIVTLLIAFPITLMLIFLVFAAAVAIKTVFDKLQYDQMDYDFYKTKIEYRDGFINKEEKELKYKHIREITMTQGILERMFHIGTIRIYTAASSGVYNGNNHGSMRGRNGIYIHCVENVQEEYKKIKQIIDEGTPDD